MLTKSVVAVQPKSLCLNAQALVERRVNTTLIRQLEQCLWVILWSSKLLKYLDSAAVSCMQTLNLYWGLTEAILDTSLVYLAICQTTIWQDFVKVSLLVVTHAQNTIQLLNCSILAYKMTKPNLPVAILYIILAHERCL